MSTSTGRSLEVPPVSSFLSTLSDTSDSTVRPGRSPSTSSAAAADATNVTHAMSTAPGAVKQIASRNNASSTLSVHSQAANASADTATGAPKRIVPPRRSSSVIVVPVEGTLNPDALFGTAGSGGLMGGSDSTSGKSHGRSGRRSGKPKPEEYNAPPPHTQLTPLRAHYLKRELVGGQLAKELDGLGSPDALSIVGWPFVRKPRTVPGGGRDGDDDDLPLLRFFLHQFVMTFPFLSDVDIEVFYSKKLQPFIESFMARNISMNEEREEETGVQTKRHKLAGKAEKHLGLLISSAVKLCDNGGREEVVRIVDVKALDQYGASSPSPTPTLPPKDTDPARDRRFSTSSSLSGQSHKLRSSAGPSTPHTPGTPPQPGTASTTTTATGETLQFAVNVIGVRAVSYRNKIGKKTKHEEFLVRTSRPGAPDVFVSRRYGDFVGLSQLLRNEFPDYDIRAPPAKDRRGVDAASQASTSSYSPFSPSSANTADSDAASIAEPSAPVVLSRERNRLTLRAYLRHLLMNVDVANSPSLQAFLLNGTTTLTDAEEADANRREDMDRLREAETAKFRSEVSARVRELEQYLRGFKDELVKKDGLRRVFATIRETKRLQDLPVEYQKVMEWARISLASTVYQLFLGSDQSSAIFSQFKRVHGLMPYFMMRQILKISNPVAMIRAGLDLFLARPFGSSSLLQRMFSSGLESELKELREDLLRVQDKIEDDSICERIKRFIYAPRNVQQGYRNEAKAETMDLVTVLMRSRSEDMPPMSPQTFQRIHRASIAHREYLEWVATLQNPEEEDEGPNNDDAWLYEDIHVFMRMYMRIRDKEQLLELIFEGNTSDLLKDIVTIFYEPLAKVYKAANISDSLYDLQNFIYDLIKTVEAAEASVSAAAADPQKTVTTFMDLVQRHENAFYNFVHSVHSKGEDLFDGLMIWIELFLNFIREGLNPDGITLDFLLPHGGEERQAIMAEVDAVIDYHRSLKIAHHERLRRRLIKGEASGAASYTTGSGVVGSPGQVGFGNQSAGEDAAFVDGVLKNLSMTGVADDIDDLNAEIDDDSEDDDDDARSDEFVDASSGSPGPSDHLTQRMNAAHLGGQAWHQPTMQGTQTTEVRYLPPEPQSAKSTKKSGPGAKRPKATKIEEPELVHIPKLVPIFTEMLKPSLETAQRVQMLKEKSQKVKSAQAGSILSSLWR